MNKNTPTPEAHVRLRRAVLIVDDNEEIVTLTAMLLRQLGFDVYEAYDMEGALTAYRLHFPEVVILDIGLPLVDGYEVARLIRKESEGRDLNLIAMTGYGQARDKARSTEAGFDHHLTKPVSITTLQTIIGQARS